MNLVLEREFEWWEKSPPRYVFSKNMKNIYQMKVSDQAESAKFGVCLDCAAVLASKNAPTDIIRCDKCHSPRIVCHEELHDMTIGHVDCDAFYASIEKRDRPDLAGHPVIVGGRERGVVAAACYQARIHGVRSAMPVTRALKLCPHAIVIKPDMQKYATVGREIRGLMRSLTPLVEPISIDEAFLDMSGTERLHGVSPAVALVQLAIRIEREIGVTVSIGLSHNKFLAKLASDMEKPRGLTVIGRAETRDRLAAMEVAKIWGVGASLQKRLARDGVSKIGDLRVFSEGELTRRYGAIGGRLYRLTRGRDDRRVVPNSPTKSVSAETTFSTDVTAAAEISRRIWLLSEDVSRRLKAKGLAGRSLQLKLRTAKFRTLTRSRTLTAPTQLAERIFQTLEPVAHVCLDELRGQGGFRLAGVGVSGLVGDEYADPPDIAEPDRMKIKKLEEAIDAVRENHGSRAIVKGRALDLARRRPLVGEG